MAAEIETDRLAQARATARELVEQLELGNMPIAQSLSKAQRLARLMRDTDAQQWLDLETRGYPAEFDAGKVGNCAKYVYRFIGGETSSIFRTSLPQLEAQMHASVQVLAKLNAPSLSAPAANFTEAKATQELMRSVLLQIANARDASSQAVAQFHRMASHLYRFAADTLVALEFGDVAENVFQAARTVTDEFIRAKAPKATEQLLAANERLLGGTAEDLAASLTSCRRVLCTVADALFPPQTEDYIDGRGKVRKVGADQYKNRLVAYAEQRIKSASSRELLGSNLEHIAARLDVVYEKTCKGVHADVTVEEARMVMIQTYLMLAELARVGAEHPALGKDAAPGEKQSKDAPKVAKEPNARRKLIQG
jgi:hypothetical protein